MTRTSDENSHDFKRNMANNLFVTYLLMSYSNVYGFEILETLWSE